MCSAVRWNRAAQTRLPVITATVVARPVQDLGRHTICAVMTAEFLEHQRSIGNDLLTPVPEHRFPGLLPGDRWCVTALNWLRAHHDGCAAPVVLASTHERTLEVVPGGASGA